MVTRAHARSHGVNRTYSTGIEAQVEARFVRRAATFGGVPELPDLAILADAIDTSLHRRPFVTGTTPQSLVLRGTQAELAAYAGQGLIEVYRRGKFLVFNFERDRMIFNPMLTGRLGLAGLADKKWPQAAALFAFAAAADSSGNTRRPRPLPEWPGGNAEWLPSRAAPIELRYRDATRMGKIYLLPVGIERAVAGWDEQGPDADDPALTIQIWRERIGRYQGELKNLLRNQAFVAGIGNAYSDEILWEARLAPFRKRSSLASDEVDALYEATRNVLDWAIAQLRLLVPPRLEVEQREFLRVHRKGGQSCPRCGTRISEVSAGGFVTNYCRGCQR
jgi:formamidopyrimidine-DNA glycosylase